MTADLLLTESKESFDKLITAVPNLNTEVVKVVSDWNANPALRRRWLILRGPVLEKAVLELRKFLGTDRIDGTDLVDAAERVATIMTSEEYILPAAAYVGVGCVDTEPSPPA